MPDSSSLTREMKPIDPWALHKAVRSVAIEVLDGLEPQLGRIYNQLTLPENEQDTLTPQDMSRRRLRNATLRLLTERRDRVAKDWAYAHFENAKCMTDKYAALLAIANMEHKERDVVFSRFYNEANGKFLPNDKCRVTSGCRLVKTKQVSDRIRNEQ